MQELPDNVSTPVNITNLEFELKDHTNREFVSYLLLGLRQGFEILVLSLAEYHVIYFLLRMDQIKCHTICMMKF